ALNLQKPVNSNDQSHIFSRQTDGAQHNHHGDKSGLGYTCSPDAGCCSCDTKFQIKPRTVTENT
ncbi:hypothetical protein N320_00529, partial [Buceros rhinoceros silvestris]